MTYFVPQSLADSYQRNEEPPVTDEQVPAAITDVEVAAERLHEIERILRDDKTKSDQTPARVPDAKPTSHKGETLPPDARLMPGFEVPPPTWETDPVAYHRTKKAESVNIGIGWAGMTGTVIFQGMAVTPDLIASYATAEEWFFTLTPWYALFAIPLCIGLVFKAKVTDIQKRDTNARVVPLNGVTRGQYDRWKQVFKHGAPEERDALNREIWTKAKTERDEREKALAEDKKAREIAAKVKAQENLNAEQARALVLAALAEERKATEVAHEESLPLATERHDRIREAYIEIITDPLNALEHASLFDVGDPRTSRFVQAYLDIEDMVTVYRSGIPTSLASSYAEKVRACARLWDDALAYSTKRSYSWLPPDEADLARKAAALLARAVGEPGSEMTPEQILSARQAAKMLDKITTITLPKQARAVIEATARLEITA